MTTIDVSSPAERNARPARKVSQYNWIGGSFGWVWLVIIMLPIYWMVITSLKTSANYYDTNALLPPKNPTLDNYRLVIQNHIGRYFLNSVVVTLGAVIPAVAISLMAAYAIIRGVGNRWLRSVNWLFLMGLAIPLQAVIIPIYLIIIRLGLYDTLLAIVLPSISFAIPLSVLVLSNFIRDVPRELFESMRVDGATEWGTLWRLVFPLTRPALITVAIYNGIGIWNGLLLPLVLTQSRGQRTLPLALADFQGQASVILAAITLTLLPIVILYALGRRQLQSGLIAGVSK